MASTARTKTLPGQKIVNAMIGGLMHTPVVAKGVGKRLVTIYVIGRKSGKTYTIPVAYTQDGADLLIGTPFGWARNLRTGEPVEILLKGKRLTADVTVYTEQADVTRLFAQMCSDNGAFAKFNKIGFTADKTPNPDDLLAAWKDGSRAVRLTPRSG